MSEKKFSKKHEWVSIEGDIATVGITKHATELLGDIVFVEVPETGKTVEKNGQTAVVESTKAASDVYSPISGEVIEGNKSIVDDPVSVNTDPEGASWFFKLKIKELIDNGSDKKRVGILPEGKVIARENTKVFSMQGEEIGLITSGTFGPSVNAPVAMGYINAKFSEIGTTIQLEVRGKKYGGKVSELPFFKKSYVK